MSTPNNNNQDFTPNNNAPQHSAPQQEEPKKKMGAGKKIGIGVVVVAALAVIAGAGGGDSSDSTASSSTPSDTAVTSEAVDPDAPLAVGDTYTTDDGMEVTVNSFTEASDSFNTYLGVNVTYTNNSDKQQDFGDWDWEIQTPAGVVANSTIAAMGDDLPTAEIAPGGTVTGTVYFTHAGAGDYAIHYEPFSSFSGDAATWNASL